MTEATPNNDPGRNETKAQVQYANWVLEIAVGVALIGAILWLSQNYEPRSILGRGLVDLRIWILVLLVSGAGTAASLIPYYVGQRGTEAVFAHYPRLEGRPWQRLESAFGRWGALTLVLSGIPGLGAALLVAAGAFGIRRHTFLGWAFLGKVLRYWVVIFVVLYSLRLVG